MTEERGSAEAAGTEAKTGVEAGLVDRLAALPHLDEIPREELRWLVEHGQMTTLEEGAVVAPMGKRIETLWVLLSGRISVHVDRGTGPRLVITWGPGDVSGMLPYSRMTGPPGHNAADERTELLLVHEDHFPEMVHRCPVFTAYTVHLMLDRARSFEASELQNEKMIALGRLAAGLAHELNNPASAAVRGARLLGRGLTDADTASRELGAAALTPEQLERIEDIRAACVARPGGDVLSPIQHADREDAILAWLERNGADRARAEGLGETAVTLELLDDLAAIASGETLDTVLAWIAAGCSTRALAVDIERAAGRIHELVAAVKRFTYMDRAGVAEYVDVEAGLRDTIRVMASKAREKDAAVVLDIAPALPRAFAVGGELNQVWLNLLDNALDAVGPSGSVEVTAREEAGRVMVRFADDGPGIPEDVMPHVFDPFFTTKPPGQGTGLGLEICRRLVGQWKGEITVESRPGRTEFRVALRPEP